MIPFNKARFYWDDMRPQSLIIIGDGPLPPQAARRVNSNGNCCGGWDRMSPEQAAFQMGYAFMYFVHTEDMDPCHVFREFSKIEGFRDKFERLILIGDYPEMEPAE